MPELAGDVDAAFDRCEGTARAFRAAVFHAQTSCGQLAGGERLLTAREAHVDALRGLITALQGAAEDAAAHPGLAEALARAAATYARDIRAIAPHATHGDRELVA